MKIFYFLFFALFLWTVSWGAEVDTVSVYSSSMKKEINTFVVLPEKYDELNKMPVVYLLHGHGGSYRDWLDRVPAIKELADAYSMILVCSDGGKNSWYWDSPEVPSYRYETYFTEELIPWVDKRYKTRPNRAGRAITGLSMGGQGALYLSFRHQDLFGAAGSTAGGVDIRPFPENWGMATHLGSFQENRERWKEYALVEMLYLLKPGALELIIDCGIGDFFYPVNETLHKKLLLRNIPHRYITGPGKHNWDYWENSIEYQLLFFKQYFEKDSLN